MVSVPNSGKLFILILHSCAALNGIPSEIVQRAEDLIVLTMRGGDLVGLCCQIPEDESAELEEAVSVTHRSEFRILNQVRNKLQGVSCKPISTKILKQPWAKSCLFVNCSLR